MRAVGQVGRVNSPFLLLSAFQALDGLNEAPPASGRAVCFTQSADLMMHTHPWPGHTDTEVTRRGFSEAVT